MSKRSKDIISATLIHLMEESPFEAITISEICDHTTLVRKTFYNNFDSKEAVITYVIEKLVLDYLAMIKEVNIFTPREMSYLYFHFGKSNQKIMSMLLENNLFHLFRVEFEKCLPSINPLIPNNKYQSLSGEDLDYVFAFHTAGVIRILELWIQTGFKKSAREMSEIYETISLGFIDKGAIL